MGRRRRRRNRVKAGYYVCVCNNVITVIDKYTTVIHNMLVLSSCTMCNRLCKVGSDCMVLVCFVGLELV